MLGSKQSQLIFVVLKWDYEPDHREKRGLHSLPPFWGVPPTPHFSGTGHSCLPPPDSRWLPLFAFSSTPFGPLPVPVRGSRAQPLPVGPAIPHGPGATSHCVGSAVPPAGHSPALALFASFHHSEEHWPTFGSAPPPWRRSPGHGPFPLPAPAARWRPHSAFGSGLLGCGTGGPRLEGPGSRRRPFGSSLFSATVFPSQAYFPFPSELESQPSPACWPLFLSWFLSQLISVQQPCTISFYPITHFSFIFFLIFFFNFGK